jgi:hypothetical protein
MPELNFAFAVGDPLVSEEALRLGNTIIINRRYSGDEEFPKIVSKSDLSTEQVNKLYILPDPSFVDEIFFGRARGQDNQEFFYIMDRVGAAGLLLIEGNRSATSPIRIGSLALHYRTYANENAPLRPLPKPFFDAFRGLKSFITRSAQPLANARTPKIVHAFPKALALLRSNPSLSPLATLMIPASN